MVEEHRKPEQRRGGVDRSPEAIHAEMIRTRAALSDKIDELEDRVSTKVRTVKAKVGEVRDKVRIARDKVRRTFDVPAQVREHPWPAFGASVLAGIVLGSITRERERLPHAEDALDAGLRRPARRMEPFVDAPAREKPGMFAEEFRHLRQTAVGAMMSLVRNGVKQAFPGIALETGRVIDGITRKLGGEPVRDLFEASGE